MIKPPGFHRRLLCLALLILALLLPISVHGEEEEAPPPPAATEGQPSGLIQLYTWATILPKEFIDLQKKVNKSSGLAAIEKQLPALAQEIEDIQWEVILAKSSLPLQSMQISTYQNKAFRVKNRLTRLSDPVTNVMADLSNWRKQWQENQSTLASFKQQEGLSLTLADEQQKELEATIAAALKLIEEHLNAALLIGKRIGDLQVMLYSIDTDLQSMEAELRKTATQQTSPSMLSADFYRRINLTLLTQFLASSRLFLEQQIGNLKNNYRLLGASIAFLFLLGWLIRWTGRIVNASSRWYPFATCPVATTVFIAGVGYSFVSMLPVNLVIPQQWEALLHIMIILSVIKLTRHIVDDQWKRQLLTRLAVFMAFTLLLVTLNLPQTLILLYVFYASIIALIFYVYQLRGIKEKGRLEAWIRKAWGVFPFLILLTGLTGYDQLAVYFFASLLATVVSCLVLWMLFRLNSGFLDLLLELQPFDLLKLNQQIITQSLHPILAWLHILLLIAVFSVIWELYPTVTTALIELNRLGFDLGGLHISPGFILSIVFIFYAALLSSRAIQALLLTEILPHYGAEKGVQLSITRLVHYAILTIGFFILLRVLGFELKQLTLIGGALGVGIGFGLQAIVNNFASGLILLFERPVKVGDTVQIGSEFGEVKKLGLRATIIQTYDNAEIVVPNSDLVTGQVTNWTLADRKVRVRIPVGVAYGSDVTRVQEILTACARNNPMVLNTPKPIALFLCFGASSLDFELRVWIPEFLDKLTVLSDLNVDIESEFALNGIEIPFPQTDLHLRSVDSLAAARLSGQPEPVDSPGPASRIKQPANEDGASS